MIVSFLCVVPQQCVLVLLLGLGCALTQAVESPYSGASYGQSMASHGTAGGLGSNYAAPGSAAAVAARAVQQVAYAPASAAYLNQGRVLAAGPAYATAALPLFASGAPAYGESQEPSYRSNMGEACAKGLIFVGGLFITRLLLRQMAPGT